ncbi:MAG: tetratricopeptide repeat protein [Deltaproteobacteria bacterium]|nr:tetratricopeptide repeat protein [Deltaproteobacteria bacterium]
MAKRYVCVNCQADFELEVGAERRCPKCLRTHGIDEADARGPGGAGGPARDTATSRKPIVVGAVTLAIALGAVIFLATRPRETPPVGPLGPSGTATSANWFNATAELKAFASKASSGASDDAAKAAAIVAAIRDLTAKLKVDDVSAGAARPPLSPEAFLKGAEAGTLKEAYAFEVAILAAAALQLAGGKGQIALLSQERPRVLPQKDTAGDIGEFVLVAGAKAWSAADLKEVPASSNAETLDAAAVRAEQLNVEAIHWLRQKDTFKANQANEQAMKLSKAANILITRAYLMVQNSAPKEAVALATKSVELAPGRGDYQYVLAVALLAAREPRRAAVAIDKALAAYTNFPSALIAKGMIAIAEAQEVARGGEKAADADGGAAAEDPEAKVQALLKKASESFAKAAEVAPKYGPAHLALAEAKLLAGDADGAKEAIGKALEIDPKLAEAHLKLAALHMQSRDVQKAKASIEEALKLEPKRVDARLMLAAILAESGDAVTALAEAKKASETDKGSREAAMFVAKLYFESDAKEAAIAEARRILTVHPDFEQGRLYLAVMLLKGGKKGDADKEFAEVVRRSADPKAMQKKVDEIKEIEGDDVETAADAGAARGRARDEAQRGSARREGGDDARDDDDVETPSARRDEDLQLRLGGERRRRGARLLDE